MASNQKTGKKKLCWNCEGTVDREAENCVYCGVYLHPDDVELIEEEENSPQYAAEPTVDEEIEEDDFEPPYTEESSSQNDNLMKRKPVTPYTSNPQDLDSREEELDEDFDEEALEKLERPIQSSSEFKTIVLPIVFLVSGAFCFIFSLIMYFFANDGVFTLRWNANYWFIYILLSLPLLFVGWRTLRQIEERDE